MNSPERSHTDGNVDPDEDSDSRTVGQSSRTETSPPYRPPVETMVESLRRSVIIPDISPSASVTTDISSERADNVEGVRGQRNVDNLATFSEPVTEPCPSETISLVHSADQSSVDSTDLSPAMFTFPEISPVTEEGTVVGTLSSASSPLTDEATAVRSFKKRLQDRYLEEQASAANKDDHRDDLGDQRDDLGDRAGAEGAWKETNCEESEPLDLSVSKSADLSVTGVGKNVLSSYVYPTISPLSLQASHNRTVLTATRPGPGGSRCSPAEVKLEPTAGYRPTEVRSPALVYDLDLRRRALPLNSYGGAPRPSMKYPYPHPMAAVPVIRSDFPLSNIPSPLFPHSAPPIMRREPASSTSFTFPLPKFRPPMSPKSLTETQCCCPVCGQVFHSFDSLTKHMVKHLPTATVKTRDDGKLHLCKICNRGFSRSDMLTRHMRLHTGLKPYDCQFCGQVFSRSDHLNTHTRTHTGVKPYACPRCPYAASRRDMITRHMRVHSRRRNTATAISEDVIEVDRGESSHKASTSSCESTEFTGSNSGSTGSASTEGATSHFQSIESSSPKSRNISISSVDSFESDVFSPRLAVVGREPNYFFTEHGEACDRKPSVSTALGQFSLEDDGTQQATEDGDDAFN